MPQTEPLTIKIEPALNTHGALTGLEQNAEIHNRKDEISGGAAQAL